jgi:hypothetical protein
MDQQIRRQDPQRPGKGSRLYTQKYQLRAPTTEKNQVVVMAKYAHFYTCGYKNARFYMTKKTRAFVCWINAYIFFTKSLENSANKCVKVENSCVFATLERDFCYIRHQLVLLKTRIFTKQMQYFQLDVFWVQPLYCRAAVPYRHLGNLGKSSVEALGNGFSITRTV